MKVLKSIGLYFVYPFSTFILGIFTHIGYCNFFYPNKDITLESSLYTNEKVYEASTGPEAITTCDTKFTISEYNLKEDSENVYSTQLPEKYLGLSRQELEDALEDYEINPTLEDQEKGFISLQLESFSEDEIKISKNYNPIDKKTGYYLMVQDGKVVVMEEDKETVYLTTDIYAEALSDHLKQELIMGKFIYNIEELYGFLESYSS